VGPILVYVPKCNAFLKYGNTHMHSYVLHGALRSLSRPAPPTPRPNSHHTSTRSLDGIDVGGRRIFEEVCVRVCVFVCVHMFVCVHVFARACKCVCVYVCVYV
jgi:hypothetical protein